jgi:hypothetical protein
MTKNEKIILRREIAMRVFAANCTLNEFDPEVAADATVAADALIYALEAAEAEDAT